MRLWSAYILSLTIACFALGVTESPISMDELDLLLAKREWSQVLLHLPGVRSADRGPKWDALVEKAAIGHLKVTSEESPSNAISITDDLLKAFPALFRSQGFEQEKNRIAILGFEACYGSRDDTEECGRRLREYIRRARDPIDLTIQAARMVARKLGAAHSVAIYSMELSAVSRDRLCALPDFKEAILAGLASKIKKIAEDSTQVVRDHCFAQLKERLSAEAKRAPASLARRRICSLLASKKLPCK